MILKEKDALVSGIIPDGWEKIAKKP